MCSVVWFKANTFDDGQRSGLDEIETYIKKFEDFKIKKSIFSATSMTNDI